MKTIFISVFQGTEFRNIIRTDIYKELSGDPSIRLILFTDSNTKREYFEKQFKAENVVYEVIDGYKPHWTAPFFNFLKFNLIKTATIDLKRKRKLLKDKDYLSFTFSFIFNRIFANSIFRKFVRFINYHFVGGNFFRKYFDKYNPDLVFLAHLFSDVETSFLRESKRRGVLSVGLINSWDKLTARNMLLLLPDKMIVHNRIVEKEAISIADMNPNEIEVVGVPHFDFHINTERSSRYDFAKKAGLDPNKRYIVFCPEGKTYIDSDGEVVKLLDNLIYSGVLPGDLQLIVRLPPNDSIDLSDYKTNVVIHQSGKKLSSKRGIDWDMNKEDMLLLLDTLFHSSLVVLYMSTIAIEAAIFDKPIISINLDFENYPSARWIYDYEHCRKLMSSGGCRMIYTKEELIEWINKYLSDPSLDSSGRERLRSDQCYIMDGMSGKRTAVFLKKLIGIID